MEEEGEEGEEDEVGARARSAPLMRAHLPRCVPAQRMLLEVQFGPGVHECMSVILLVQECMCACAAAALQ